MLCSFIHSIWVTLDRIILFLQQSDWAARAEVGGDKRRSNSKKTIDQAVLTNRVAVKKKTSERGKQSLERANDFCNT